MLVTLIPLFDEQLTVKAYSVFTQKKNTFQNPSLLGTGSLDGASHVVGLDFLETVEIDALTDHKLIFVPVTDISVFSELETRSKVPHERLVLLFDNRITPQPMYVERLQVLKASGYGLAIRKLDVAKFEEYSPILGLMDYIFLDVQKIDVEKASIYFGQVYPNIQLCVGNIPSMDAFVQYHRQNADSLYEGAFYRVPVDKGIHEVSPLKVNYIQLLNLLNAPDFALDQAKDIISRDTALVIELLKMVNRMTVYSGISSINHAIAMLGERELRKWLTTVVAENLYMEKPNEVTRLSLIRAKMAENLAPIFGLAAQSQELFLLGLFSVLDLILDMPMNEALKIVHIPDHMAEALVAQTGSLAPVLEFILQYESANWQEISRLLVIHQIDDKKIFEAYQNALQWYGEML